VTSGPLLASITHQAEELLALLTLRFPPQLGPRRIENLRERFGSARAALAMPSTELHHTPGLDAKSLAGIRTVKPAQQAEAELRKLECEGVTLLGRGLPGYPAALDALVGHLPRV
jgi:DNA processing protein